MISGFLYKASDRKSQLKKTFRQLILPLFILALLYNLFNTVGNIVFGSHNLDTLYHNIFGIITGNVHALGGLWFVYTLALIKLTSILLSNSVKPILAILCLGVVYYLNTYHHYVFYSSYYNLLLAYPIYYGGEYLSRYKRFLGHLSDKRILFSVAILGFIGVLIAYINNDTIWMYKGSYGTNIYYFLIGSFSGTAMCYAFCKLIFNKANRFVTIVSEGTILILAFQGLIIRIAHQFDLGYLFYIEAILLVICFIPIIFFCKKNMPVLIGFRGTKTDKEPENSCRH